MARLTTALRRRYTIERELGRGGMGTLYLALDLKHGRRVAIKILPPDLAQAVGPDRFLREIEISARLTHPHILSVHDSGQAGGLLYYIMPFVAGESLRERLDREGALPLEQALRIVGELADALGYAHSEGIIHRDVKPDNVMIAGEHAFLTDFGVARALDRPSELTESGLAVGTRRYASPEQAAGSRAVDLRTDLYSLGCVLFEMLAGPAAEAALERRLVEPLSPLTRVRPELPPWIDSVITRATARHPDDRFQTAQEFRDAILKTSGSVPPVLGVAQGARRRGGSRGRRIAASIAVLALIAGGFALQPLRRSAAHLDGQSVLVAGFENRTVDSSLASLGEIASDYIARGLAATHLLRDVFDARALGLRANQRPEGDAAASRALASRVGAGLVLRGSYFREGDQLHFEAQLVDAASGRVVLALEPVVGNPAEQTRVVELLRQRVMAGFAVALSPRFESWGARTIPPTYEAYQEMLAGEAAAWVYNMPEALAHFRRAASLDTGFTSAQTAVALQLFILSDCAGVDSVATLLAPRLPLVAPADRYQLGYATAACQKDHEAALKAAKAWLSAAPMYPAAVVFGAIEAMKAARPREALSILLRYDPSRAGLGGEPLVGYRDWIGFAHHWLGEYTEELAIARLGLRDAPTSRLQFVEARALAGLGRGAEAEQLANQWVSDHLPGDALKGPKAQCVALELLAHGDSARGRRLMERTARWYGELGLLAAASDGTALSCLWDRFTPHYYMGDWDAARAAYQQLLAQDVFNPKWRRVLRVGRASPALLKAKAALATIALRRGRLDEARRLEAELATSSDPTAIAARARLALLRGQRDSALSLLRRAADQGLDWLERVLYLHLDPDFAPLRDDPAFRELLRPKG